MPAMPTTHAVPVPRTRFDAAPPSRPATSWSPAARFAFRFSFIALVLFIPAFPLLDWPLTGWLGTVYQRVWDVVVQSTARYLLHVSFPVPHEPMDASDSIANWLMMGCIVMLALFGAAVWTAVDRREAHPRLKEVLDVAVRLTLGVTLWRYGVEKLYPVQFGGELQYRDLLRPLGDFTPLALLWQTMGYSRPYVIFAGTIEVVAAILLLWRRTATLGALLALAALTQVLALDLSYDVTVKVYAASLLLMSVYLLVPHTARLARFFVLHAPVASENLAPHFATRRANRLAAAIKTIVVAAALVSQVRQKAMGAEFGPRSPLSGVYDVELLAQSTGIAPTVFPPGEQWTRIAIESSGFATVWTAQGDRRDMLTSLDSSTHRIVLAAAPDSLGVVSGYHYVDEVTDALRAVSADSSRRLTLTYDAALGDHLTLVGRRASDSVVVRLTRWPESRITLLGCPIHLANDRPYSGVAQQERCPWYVR